MKISTALLEEPDLLCNRAQGTACLRALSQRWRCWGALEGAGSSTGKEDSPAPREGARGSFWDHRRFWGCLGCTPQE